MSTSGCSIEKVTKQLPGLNCGICGEKTCGEFADIVIKDPGKSERCVHLNGRKILIAEPLSEAVRNSCSGCGKNSPEETQITWKDSLDREFDFILDSFPNEAGPRETIIPRNPQRTKDLDIKKGDSVIGRPMGMSCGCPVTHCGIVTDADHINGVIVWCVTGPLRPRSGESKDIGYYSAEAYEGVVKATRKELKIGMRYWFMPHRCMLQWRHSGLVNFINRRKDMVQVRIEGLMIG